MDHRGLAELAAVLGALGAVLALVPRGRVPPLAGLAVIGLAEAALAYALVPASDLHRAVHPPLRIAAFVVAAAIVIAAGFALARFPTVVPVVLLAAAPFRVSVNLGSQSAFLLFPLYGVLAASVIALALRALRRERARDVPLTVALAAGAFVAFDAVSLTWSSDPRAGSIELAFFVLPFAALLAVAARSPFAPWLPRALAVTITALAAVFAAIGLWQLHSHHLPYARDLEVVNAYSSFTRTASIFKDPSIYARHLVLALTVLLVAVWLRRAVLAVAVPIMALLFAGLYFSYSQSSELTLFVVTLAVTLVAAERRTRVAVAAVCAVVVVVGGIAVGLSSRGHSVRSFTSGRSHLISVTATVVKNHPVAGVGVGAQPLASKLEADHAKGGKRKNASHATPLTVAAELGVIGVILYIGFLAAVAGLVAAVWAADAALALGLGAVFLALFVHSLFYSGFFEDPIMWGIPAVAASYVVALGREGRAARFTAWTRLARRSPSAGSGPATAPSPRN